MKMIFVQEKIINKIKKQMVVFGIDIKIQAFNHILKINNQKFYCPKKLDYANLADFEYEIKCYLKLLIGEKKVKQLCVKSCKLINEFPRQDLLKDNQELTPRVLKNLYNEDEQIENFYNKNKSLIDNYAALKSLLSMKCWRKQK